MTVCIAARSEGSLIGISDRMLTSGDIQFEPSSTTKMTALSNSIAIMASGDAAFHTEIMREIHPIIAGRIEENPAEWWLVKDVADLYVKYRNAAKLKRAESALLAPLGLTVDNYREEINKFNDAAAEQIMRDLIQFEVPYTAVIITGVDPLGAHIYVVDDGNVSCNDVIGFAAVGIGARHAESQFMLAKHAWNSPLVDTALLAYIAKKRSEIAPGVGEATDMFTIGPAAGSLAALPETTIDGFEQIYRNLRDKEEKARDDARREANDFVTKAAAAAAEQAKGHQEPAIEGADITADKPNGQSKRDD